VARSWRAAWTAQRSDHLLAPSALVRDALVRYLRVPAGRVTLVPPGLDGQVRRPQRAEYAEVQQRLGLPTRYLLHLGTLRRRKNLPLLLTAWEAAQGSLDPGLELVVAGAVAGDGRELVERVRRSPRTRWLGYVDRRDLGAVLAGAVAWLQPSPHEGCALAALEAMACGTPPVVARGTALAEPLGGCGMALDPGDARAWSDAICLLALSSELRSRLSQEALREAASHTPEAGAEALRPLL